MQTRLSDFIMLPRVVGAGAACTPARGVLPSATTFAVSSTVVAVDLTTLAGVPTSTNTQRDEGINPKGSTGHYISVAPDGCDVYIVSGPTFASVTGANAPVARTVQTISGTGQSAPTTASCQIIKDGQTAAFLPINGIDNFLAVVTLGATTGFCTVVQSSP